MLRVLKTSGEEALNIEVAALQEAGPVEEHAVRVIDIKRYLHRSCWQPPRFRQRLLLEDGQILSDDVALDESLDVHIANFNQAPRTKSLNCKMLQSRTP